MSPCRRFGLTGAADMAPHQASSGSEQEPPRAAGRIKYGWLAIWIFGQPEIKRVIEDETNEHRWRVIGTRPLPSGLACCSFTAEHAAKVWDQSLQLRLLRSAGSHVDGSCME